MDAVHLSRIRFGVAAGVRFLFPPLTSIIALVGMQPAVHYTGCAYRTLGKA
jgi:cytochrome bd-type quinol oxidase subunit 1